MLVNYTVEINRVEFICSGTGVFNFDAHPGELFKDIFDALVSRRTMVDEPMNGINHGVVNVRAYPIRGKAHFYGTFFARGLRFVIENACRNAHCGCTFRHILHYNRVGADLRASPDGYRAENFGTGSDHHSIAQGWMAFSFYPRCAAERNAMIERAVVADLGGFPDDDAHAVVNEKTPRSEEH